VDKGGYQVITVGGDQVKTRAAEGRKALAVTLRDGVTARRGAR
jgi:hypothetical protein